MTLVEIRKDKPYLAQILNRMFKMAGADENMELKNDWYLKYEWTEKHEEWFILWLKDYLRDAKVMREITGHTITNALMRRKVAEYFVSNYGWKINTNKR